MYQTTNAGANWTQVAAVFPVEPASSGCRPSMLLFFTLTRITVACTFPRMRAPPGLPLITAYRSCRTSPGSHLDSLNANRAFLLVPVSEAGFLTQLNAAGTSFGYSTYFGSAGGSGTTTIYGLATNTSGRCLCQPGLPQHPAGRSLSGNHHGVSGVHQLQRVRLTNFKFHGAVQYVNRFPALKRSPEIL